MKIGTPSTFAALVSVAVSAFTAQPTMASFVALFIVNPIVLMAVILMAQREGKCSE